MGPAFIRVVALAVVLPLSLVAMASMRRRAALLGAAFIYVFLWTLLMGPSDVDEPLGSVNDSLLA